MINPTVLVYIKDGSSVYCKESSEKRFGIDRISGFNYEYNMENETEVLLVHTDDTVYRVKEYDVEELRKL